MTIKKRHFLIVAIIAIVILITYSQLNFEFYLRDQKLKYGILDHRERKVFIPLAFWFFFKNDKHVPFRLIPYLEKDILSLSAIKIYDEYIFYCYYSKEEKQCIEKKFPNQESCFVNTDTSSSFE